MPSPQEYGLNQTNPQLLHTRSTIFKIKKIKHLYFRHLTFKKVVPPGIEPGTHGFSVRCSTN